MQQKSCHITCLANLVKMQKKSNIQSWATDRIVFVGEEEGGFPRHCFMISLALVGR